MNDDRPNRIHLGDQSMSLEEAIEKATHISARQFEPDLQPHLEDLKTILLSESTRTWKIAKYWGIRNPKTGRHSHYTLNLETLSRTKQYGWESKTDKSLTIDDKGPNDSIERLFSFLASQARIRTAGEYLVMSITDIASDDMQQMFRAISASQENRDLMSQILAWLTRDPETRAGLSELAATQDARTLVAAMNHARLSQALDHFKRMVDQNLDEICYQKFLQDNHWIFGGEYNELLIHRNIVKNVQLDFPALRTADGYLEIIEIKRPIKDRLFRKNGKTFTETKPVADAITQTDDYLSRIDREAFQLESEDGLDVEKVRGKVIIGRDIDDVQMNSLRRLNARTNRIEVMTFDQLIAIAERILRLLAKPVPVSSEVKAGTHENVPSTVDDIPL